jgi:hypothetical protein
MPYKRNRSWKPIIDRAYELATEYEGVLTLRGLFYRLLSDEWIRNSDSDYNQLSKKTAQARRDGMFPDLLEHGRKITRYPSWSSPREAQQAIHDQYRRPHTEGQEYNVYVGVEKEAMIGALVRWYGDRGYPLLALKGYSSQTLVNKVRRDIEADGRLAILVYAGDLDASGIDIDRSFTDLVDSFNEVIRVAITPEQIAEYGLIKLPGNHKDTRAAAFIKRYGSLFQVELEALDPFVLKQKFDHQLDDMWDEEVYQEVLEREERERKYLLPSASKNRRILKLP